MNAKSWYTPGMVVSALCAAMVVTACGPQNGEPVAAAPAPAPATTPAPAPVQAVPAPAPTYRAAAPAPAPVRSDRLGQVSSIEPITATSKPSGVGAVAGGVLGGVLGHQVGNGTGRDVATVAGAVGGAVVGNKIEKNRSEKVVGYRVHVTLDNGQQRTFEQTGSTGLQVGDRVRVDGNQIRRA
ncbi:glycine zipper 2TM domain-containing protein [Rhizobacter sp. SG703]|uniref:glycine zipper 2TM domain-containing protein n=1 Tax=Rhizobacter sp. SG703 TaxID=2587140 RepID=UPI001447D74D|nr:glycine zipper 2TM domain-containing protein [Rhizobacter sp. SG703]NKI94087.1 outer membrane lipoprotein SlyB [Rhizobacter sp. SG703]